MDGYFVHLNSSTLRVGFYNGVETPKFAAEDLLPTAVSLSKIIDPVEFSKEFSRVLAQHLGDKLPKLPLYFVLEPEVTELFLLTGNKNGGNDQESLEKQIKDKLVDKKMEDFYYTYYKIAPFIYQFVGIKRDYLNAILETGNILGLEINAILPWGLILAKTNHDVSSMFVFPNNGVNCVVFSELTGVTFAEKFEGKASLEELKDLFWKLSVYNNKKSELNTYTFARLKSALGPHPLLVLEEGNLENNFEEIDLVQKTLEKNVSVIDSQANLLKILPVLQVEESKKVPAVMIATVLSIVLVAGLTLQLTVGFNNILGKGTSDQTQNVLANQDQTPAGSTESAKQEEAKVPQKKEVKRADLKIRVENGNGITGSAGKLKTYLEGFGYNVLEPGNSDRSDYAKTQIKLPKELEDYRDLLTNDLKTNYSVEIVSVDSKPANYDVLIIAGGS